MNEMNLPHRLVVALLACVASPGCDSTQTVTARSDDGVLSMEVTAPRSASADAPFELHVELAGPPGGAVSFSATPEWPCQTKERAALSHALDKNGRAALRARFHHPQAAAGGAGGTCTLLLGASASPKREAGDIRSDWKLVGPISSLESRLTVAIEAGGKSR